MTVLEGPDLLLLQEFGLDELGPDDLQDLQEKPVFSTACGQKLRCVKSQSPVCAETTAFDSRPP